MDAFPHPLFPLICTSLCLSVLSLIFATLAITFSHLLWIIPAAFLATIAYHAVTIILSNAEPAGSLRLYSLSNVVIACILTCLWVAASGVAIALAALMAQGRLGTIANAPPKGLWALVIPAVFALLESVIMGSVAVYTRKERSRISYANKWKWRPGYGTPALSQWGIGPRGTT